MKQLQKSDLKNGDIYVTGENFLNKYNENTDRSYGLDLKNNSDFKTNWFLSYSDMREATSEEKHWLETCIKENKFISYEEAMKTFIPEYVEWIDNIGSGNLGYQTKDHFKKNKIFKTDVELPYHGFQTQNWIKHLEIYANNYKPSTKEAYDAQFVVKEPKIVLEEPKDKVLQRIDLLGKGITIGQVQCSEGGIYKIGDKITVFDKYSPNKGKMFTIQSFRWSNDKSKICVVTELHTPNGIGLDEIELYFEPKVKIIDDFVLPKKWCVKVNEELRNRFDYHEAYGYHHSIKINDTNKWSDKIKEGFIEITFEQFKKYVLKDE